MQPAPIDSDEVVDRLLGEVLDAPEARWATTLEMLCLEHPDHAKDLRQRFDYLQRVGFITPVPHDVLDAGGRFGTFEILEPVGSGGMGQVFRARRHGEERSVALKVLRPELVSRESARERLFREGRLAESLDDPALCRVMEIGEHRGTPYLVMPWISGQSLADRLHADRASFVEGEANVRGTVELFATLADAVGGLHNRGLVHRDIKPGNIIVRDDGSPVLVDFGLAWSDDVATLTQSGHAIGTPAYMPPEQVRGRDVTGASDVYALGASLYECLAGRPPFVAGDRETLYREILDQEPPRLRVLNRFVDARLERVVTRCLDKAPARRFADGELLADDLRRWLDGRPLRSRRPSIVRRTARVVRRRPITAGIVAALAVAIGLIAWAMHSESVADRRETQRRVAFAASAAKDEPLVAAHVLVDAARSLGNQLDVTARSQLTSGLDQLRQVGEIKAGHAIGQMALSPDQRTLLCAVLTPSDTDGPRVLQPGDFTGPWDRVILSPGHLAVWSPDGSWFATILGRTPREELHRDKTEVWIGTAEDPESALLSVHGDDDKGGGLHRRGRHEIGFRIAHVDDSGELFFGDARGEHLWRCHAGREPRPFWDLSPGAVVHLQSTDGGRQVLAVQANGVVTIGSPDEPSWRRQFPTGRRTVDTTHLSADERVLTLGGYHGKIDQIRLDGDLEITNIANVDGLSALGVDRTGQQLVFGSGDRVVRMTWPEPRQGRIKKAAVDTLPTLVMAAAWSEDSEQCALGGYGSGEIRIYSRGPTRGLRHVLKGHRGSVTSLMFEADGDHLLSAARDGTVRRWQLGNAGVPILSSGWRGVNRVRFADNSTVVLADQDGFWSTNLDSGRRSRAVSRVDSPKGSAPTIAVREDDPGDERIVAIGSAYGTVRFVRSTSDTFEECGAEWALPNDSPYRVLWTPTGDLLAGGLSGTLHRLPASAVLQRLATNLSPDTLAQSDLAVESCEAHDGNISAIALLDGGRIATVAGDAKLKIWSDQLDEHRSAELGFAARALDWHDGMFVVGGTTGELAIVDPERQEVRLLSGHQALVRRVDFSPDGRFFASASHDGTVRVWTRSGDLHLVIDEPHSGAAKDLAWSPDGKTIAVSYSRHAVRLWPFYGDDDRALIGEVESRLYRELDAEEVRRFRALLTR